MTKEKTPAPLPTGKVTTGTESELNLTDGIIRKGSWYQLPPTKDGKTVGKTGQVTDIEMSVSMDNDYIEFRVRLQEDNGQGWVFNFLPK
jgi:hypothetical protein